MSDKPAVQPSYPVFDATKAELIICPLSGRPLLRPKIEAGGEAYLKTQDVPRAVEESFHDATIWLSKDADK